jgi:hypothetical protein
MTQHEDFLRGFGDAMGLTDARQIETTYQAWLASEGLTEDERIDLETEGYQTGYETGEEYKKQSNEPDTND